MNKTLEQIREEGKKREERYKDKEVCPEYQEMLDNDPAFGEFLDTLEEENRIFRGNHE